METKLDGGDWEEDQVMSEVHLGCPPNFAGPFISHFTFSLPPEVELMERKYDGVTKDEQTSTQKVVSFDDDGDLVLSRRSKESKNKFVMAIQHNITSSIPSVGLQDFITLSLPGLVGMLLARVAKTVFLTDHGDEVLENCAKNVQLNSGMFAASVYIRELDWMASWSPPLKENSTSRGRYAWISSEVEEVERAYFLVAADVIYSDDLTDAFFSTLERLMSQCPNKVLYLALEKRYNFTLDDLYVVANGYSHFRSYLRDEKDSDDPQNGSLPCFVGTCIDLTQIPHYVREYVRGEDVEIWQIKYENRTLT